MNVTLHTAYFNLHLKTQILLQSTVMEKLKVVFIGHNKKNKIVKKFSVNYPHSLGLFYGTITEFLGFKPDF